MNLRILGKVIKQFCFLFYLGFLAACQPGLDEKPQLIDSEPVMPQTIDGAEMVFVPAGEFTMGSDVLDEQPEHTIYLDAYWVDKYEVTNRLYRRCYDVKGCQAPLSIKANQDSAYFENTAFDQYPVNHITWELADQYCRWAGKRLPTEAEWEKAARGVDGRMFPWGNEWDPSRVNSLFNNLYATLPVGSFPDGASPYGAYEMAGNVWEWVADWYAEDYYSSSSVENPTGPESGKTRIVRGGGYGVYDAAMRTSIRRELLGITEAKYIGFRCAVSAQP